MIISICFKKIILKNSITETINKTEIPKGEYESEKLCKECDGHRIQQFEQYASIVLNDISLFLIKENKYTKINIRGNNRPLKNNKK